MRPTYCEPIDETKYVYAICKCPLPIQYAIRMDRISGKGSYSFKCDDCGTEGTVYLRAIPQN